MKLKLNKRFFSYKRIAIIAIIIVLLYLTFQILRDQINILGIKHFFGFKEGLVGNSNNSDEIMSMVLRDKGGPGVTSVKYEKYPDTTLRDYVIKSSYNTAYTGSKMSIQAITYALTRGYRFLDFEIFMIDNSPRIGYSENSNTLSTGNTLPLGEVLYNIINGGFSAPTPNSNDPLFINLRINTVDSDIYELIAKSISKNMGSRLYSGSVNGMTKINDIMNKIVIIIDKKVSPKYADYPDCSKQPNNSTCYNLSQVTNLEGGGDNLLMVKYDDLLKQTTNPPIVKDNGTTDIVVLKMCFPDVTQKQGNPDDVTIFIKDYGVQFLAMRLYLVDTGLKAYENMFNKGGMALLPFSSVLPMINA